MAQRRGQHFDVMVNDPERFLPRCRHASEPKRVAEKLSRWTCPAHLSFELIHLIFW
jgi:hypothetical protein